MYQFDLKQFVCLVSLCTLLEGKHKIYNQVQKEQNTICWCQKKTLQLQEYKFVAGYRSLIAQQVHASKQNLAASRSLLMLVHI
jgi:hypothetical protein